MSQTTKELGRAAQILKLLEDACMEQGIEFYSFMDFLVSTQGKERDKLLHQFAMVPATGVFRTMYLFQPDLAVNLRVVAPLERLKITFGQADVLAERQDWRLLPEPSEMHCYPGVFDLLRRELVPYRLVYLGGRNSNGKFHTWKPGANLGGQVDEAECFGPQDAIVLVD